MEKKNVFYLLTLLLAHALFVGDGMGQAYFDGDGYVAGSLDLSYPGDETSLCIGITAGYHLDLTLPRYSTFIGYEAATFTETGLFNTACGVRALHYNETGSYNTAVGYHALNSTRSDYNTAVGAFALDSNSTGIENCAFGYRTGYNNESGRWNTFVGSQAGRDFRIGDSNVFIGQSNSLVKVGGSNNVSIGASAGRENNNSNNVFIGARAGKILTGSYNIVLGFEAATNQAPGSNLLWIENSSASDPLLYGDFSTHRVGIHCTDTQAALSVAGGVSATGVITAQTMTCSSDRRLKKDILDLRGALRSVGLLHPVCYDWKGKSPTEKSGQEKHQIGFIAQEVEQVYPELVKTDKNGFKAIDYSRLSAVLTSALQELIQENCELEVIQKSLEARVNSIEQKFTY